MERILKFEERPREEVERFVEPKRREKTLLERAAKGPAGRWVVAATLALSSQGCASFRVGAGPSFGGGNAEDEFRRWEEPPSAQEAAETPGVTGGDVLRSVAAVVTGEGKADSGVNIRGGYQQYGEGEGFTSVKLEPTAELPGMRQWWSKAEGAYDPEEAALQKEYKAEEENVGKAVFEKTPQRARLFKHSPATVSDHREKMQASRAKRMDTVGYGPLPQNVKRLTFEKGEKKPDAVTAVVHQRPGDTPESMMKRGIAMVIAGVASGSRARRFP